MQNIETGGDLIRQIDSNHYLSNKFYVSVGLYSSKTYNGLSYNDEFEFDFFLFQ